MRCFFGVCDEAFQRKAAVMKHGHHCIQVMFFPLRCHADTGFAHKGRGIGKGQILFVKACQYDLTTGCHFGNDPVQNTRVATDVANAAVVFAHILIGVNDFIAQSAFLANGLCFPHHRCRLASSNHHARQQSAHDAVTNDQVRIGQGQIVPAHREHMMGCGSQRQQHAFGTPSRVQFDGPLMRHHQALARAAEYVLHALKGVRAR